MKVVLISVFFLSSLFVGVTRANEDPFFGCAECRDKYEEAQRARARTVPTDQASASDAGSSGNTAKVPGREVKH